MQQLADHLKDINSHTFGGLEASDLVPDMPSAPLPTVPAGGGGTPIPPSGPPSPPSLPPSGGPPAPTPTPFGFGRASDDDKEYFSYKAKKAGKNVGQYRRDATKQVAINQREIIENQKGKREDTRRQFQVQATSTGRNLNNLRAQSKSSNTL